jgi:hypothetical protein
MEPETILCFICGEDGELALVDEHGHWLCWPCLSDMCDDNDDHD